MDNDDSQHEIKKLEEQSALYELTRKTLKRQLMLLKKEEIVLIEEVRGLKRRRERIEEDRRSKVAAIERTKQKQRREVENKQVQLDKRRARHAIQQVVTPSADLDLDAFLTAETSMADSLHFEGTDENMEMELPPAVEHWSNKRFVGAKGPSTTQELRNSDTDSVSAPHQTTSTAKLGERRDKDSCSDRDMQLVHAQTGTEAVTSSLEIQDLDKLGNLLDADLESIEQETVPAKNTLNGVMGALWNEVQTTPKEEKYRKEQIAMEKLGDLLDEELGDMDNIDDDDYDG